MIFLKKISSDFSCMKIYFLLNKVTLMFSATEIMLLK